MICKKRLDILLKDRGICASRSRAKGLIMAGKVFVNGQLVDKAGAKVSPDSEIEIRKDTIPYVSRGGVKLEHALGAFSIDVSGKKALDIGASTGGFTDCLLKKGAGKVWAVDVGYGQLDWNIRNDDRVIPIENKNARYLKQEDIGDLTDLATVDVSFISLKKVLPPLTGIVREGGDILPLVKPQFEAGPEKVGKGGIIKDPQVHLEVLANIIDFVKKTLKISVIDAIYSPITGRTGNIEFFLWLKNLPNQSLLIEIDKLVKSAWEKLS